MTRMFDMESDFSALRDFRRMSGFKTDTWLCWSPLCLCSCSLTLLSTCIRRWPNCQKSSAACLNTHAVHSLTPLRDPPFAALLLCMWRAATNAHRIAPASSRCLWRQKHKIDTPTKAEVVSHISTSVQITKYLLSDVVLYHYNCMQLLVAC